MHFHWQNLNDDETRPRWGGGLRYGRAWLSVGKESGPRAFTINPEWSFFWRAAPGRRPLRAQDIPRYLPRLPGASGRRPCPLRRQAGPVVMVVLHLPSFPTTDDALEWLAKNYPSACSVYLQRGPDGMVRGTAAVDAVLDMAVPAIPDIVVDLGSDE